MNATNLFQNTSQGRTHVEAQNGMHRHRGDLDHQVGSHFRRYLELSVPSSTRSSFLDTRKLSHLPSMLAHSLSQRFSEHHLHPKKEEGGYGPGTYTDTSFTPVPKECERILALLAQQTPGFTKDYRLLENVTFEGDDLPCIPGPIKAQAVTAALHAMSGIIGHEILDIRRTPTDHKTKINSNMGGLFPGNPALVTIDGQDGPDVLKLPTIPHLRPPPNAKAVDADFDHYIMGNTLKMRSQAIYPTATKNVWIQVHGSMNPYAALMTLGLSREFIDADNDKRLTADEAYDVIKSITTKHAAKELELTFIENSQYLSTICPSLAC